MADAYYSEPYMINIVEVTKDYAKEVMMVKAAKGFAKETIEGLV